MPPSCPATRIQIISVILQISANSLQVTQQSWVRAFCRSWGSEPTDTSITNGVIPMRRLPGLGYVIRRAMSQIGVPYSWEWRAPRRTRPRHRRRRRDGQVRLRGLILYAFAGVGIKLPHYSGSQYNMGRKIPAQMRRGDVIFYGPGGSQYVTLYLGEG